jgi:hypothetical protein
MTIRDVHATMLRMPRTDGPRLKGHPLGPSRDFLLVEAPA